MAGPEAYFYGFRLVDMIKVELNYNKSSDLSWTKLLFWTKLYLSLVHESMAHFGVYMTPVTLRAPL